MKRPSANPVSPRRVLIFVDESNITSSAKVSNRKLDWIKLRDFLVGDRALLEMVVYAGLPPAMTEWQAERDKKGAATSIPIGHAGDVADFGEAMAFLVSDEARAMTGGNFVTDGGTTA